MDVLWNMQNKQISSTTNNRRLRDTTNRGEKELPSKETLRERCNEADLDKQAHDCFKGCENN